MQIDAAKMFCGGYYTIFPQDCTVENLEVTKNDTIEYALTNPDIRSMSFKRCKFAVFPSKIFADFPNISQFRMENNALRILNGKFFLKATKMEYIFFNKNNITTLKNKVFFNMPSLKMLYVNENKVNFIGVNAFLVSK